jgi:hypothetical protein
MGRDALFIAQQLLRIEMSIIRIHHIGEQGQRRHALFAGI